MTHLQAQSNRASLPEFAACGSFGTVRSRARGYLLNNRRLGCVSGLRAAAADTAAFLTRISAHPARAAWADAWSEVRKTSNL